MRLSQETIDKIMQQYLRSSAFDLPNEMEDFLKNLDLVFKFGDSSQSELVSSPDLPVFEYCQKPGWGE